MSRAQLRVRGKNIARRVISLCNTVIPEAAGGNFRARRTCVPSLPDTALESRAEEVSGGNRKNLSAKDRCSRIGGERKRGATIHQARENFRRGYLDFRGYNKTIRDTKGTFSLSLLLFFFSRDVATSKWELEVDPEELHVPNIREDVSRLTVIKSRLCESVRQFIREGFPRGQ